MGSHLTATGRHLPYEITQCYLLPDTSERAKRCCEITSNVLGVLVEREVEMFELASKSR